MGQGGCGPAFSFSPLWFQPEEDQSAQVKEEKMKLDGVLLPPLVLKRH